MRYYIHYENMKIFENYAALHNIKYKKIEMLDYYFCIDVDLTKEKMREIFPNEPSVYAYTSDEVDDGEILDTLRERNRNSFICVTEDEKYLEDYNKSIQCEELESEIAKLKYQLFSKKEKWQLIQAQLKGTNIFDDGLVTELKIFIKACSYKEFEDRIMNEVLGQSEVLPDMIYNVYAFLESIVAGNIIKNNFIIAGPSGSGKTFFLKSVKKVLEEYGVKNFPIIEIDTSSITCEGFKGRNTSQVYQQITNACSGNDDTYAIVFLDEIDKRMVASYDSHGENINGFIQGELLTLIEGSVRDKCDTNKCLFIGAGAFQCVRDKKKNKKQEIGFGKEYEKADDFTEITFEDILELGSQPEFLGRFTGGLYNFHPMTRQSIEEVVRRLGKEVSNNEHVIVRFTSEGLNEFVNLANTKYGVRMLKRKIVETLNPVFRQLRLEASGKKNKFAEVVIKGVGDAQVNEIIDLNNVRE